MSHISARSVLLAVATFVVALQTAPGSSPAAYAGCGDYVHVGRMSEGLRSDGHYSDGRYGNGRDGDGHRGARFASSPQSPLPAAPACHAPSCRQPMLPVSPAPASEGGSLDQKACLSLRIELPLDSPELIVMAPLINSEEIPGLQIERPPRDRS